MSEKKSGQPSGGNATQTKPGVYVTRASGSVFVKSSPPPPKK